MRQMSFTSMDVQNNIPEFSSLKDLCKWIDNSKCDKCPRHKYRNSNSSLKIISGSRNFDAKIWIVGKSPGINDSITGVAFAHKSGELLEKLLHDHCSLNKNDYFITNAVFCPEVDDADPKSREIEICASYIDEMVKVADPQLFLAVGATGHKALIDPADNTENIYGKDYPFQSRFKNKVGHTIPMYTIYHTAYWLRTGGNQLVKDATLLTLSAFDKAVKYIFPIADNSEIATSLDISKQAVSQIKEETLRALRPANIIDYLKE